MGRLLSPGDICEMFPGLSETKLAQMRFKRVGPKFYKPTPKTVLYEEGEFREWLASTVVETAVA